MKGFTQSGYYKLTRRLLPETLRRALLLCAGLFIIAAAALYGQVTEQTCTLPYEALVARADIHNMLYAAAGLFAILTGVQIYRDNYRNKGYYATMLLPFPRRHVFFAYCTAGVLGILLLWAAMIGFLLMCYPVTAALCQRTFSNSSLYANAAPTLARDNGLFLAFVRGGLFRMLLPMTAPEWLSTLLVALMLGCLPAYALLGERKRMSALLAFPVTPMLFAAVGNRYASAALQGTYSNVYPFDITDGQTAFWVSTALALALLVFMLWRGIYNCNRDANYD